MYPKTLTLTVTSAAQEAALERALALTRELEQLAATAADGSILAVCEDAAVQRGQEFTRRTLEQAVQARIQQAEKKGRRSAAAPAAPAAPTRERRRARC